MVISSWSETELSITSELRTRSVVGRILMSSVCVGFGELLGSVVVFSVGVGEFMRVVSRVAST